MKVLANIPDEDIEWLDGRAKSEGTSRAALLREAVARYRAEKQDRNIDKIMAGFGAWEHRTDIGDSVEYIRRMRAEWVRPWDENYEETRAEFPDLFDEEDDREHELHKEWLASRSTPTS